MDVKFGRRQMKFKNLNPNILYFLRNKWQHLKASEKIDTQEVFEEFSDIPTENIRDAIYSMQREKLIELIPPGDKITLTQGGLSQQSIDALLRSRDIENRR
jgi:hypothetical protein